MLLRVAVVVLLLVECSSQCAFNTLSIMLGSNRFTGLTLGSINVTGVNCVAQQIVADNGVCTVTDEGYENSLTATCGVGGVFTYNPVNATLTPIPCGSNSGTAVAVSTHFYGETGLYSCPQLSSCSQHPCSSSCPSGAVDPPLSCQSNCLLGTPLGMTITTLTPGPLGENCSSSSIAVGDYSPTCALTETPGYSCGVFPNSVTCPSSQTAALITATCSENICTTVVTIPIVGVVGYPTNNDQCPNSNIILSVLSDNSCDIQCDQSAGYQFQTGKYQCGSPQDLSSQSLVSTITQCMPVTCPRNSNSVQVGQCACSSGYEGTITYNGTHFEGGCDPIPCSPFVFPSFAIPGDINGCLNNESLTYDKPRCTVKCSSGYMETTANVTCDYNTRLSQTPLQCNEKVCSPYSGFGTGIISGQVNGCIPGVQLKAVTTNSCTLSCDDGFNGADGLLECQQGAPNSVPPAEKITCRENTCIQPRTSFPGHIFSGISGSLCNSVSGCGTVSCGDGYDGSPVLSCPTLGGVFIVADPCSPVSCPMNASPLGLCNCNIGYQIEVGGVTVFNTSTSSWDHECEATCAHQSFGGCDSSVGLFLVDQYNTTACTGVSGNPAVDCDSSTCCRQTCTGYSCPSSGYTLQRSIQCQVGGCDDETCCFANCANPLYTICQQNAFSPSPNAANITCANNSIASCDSNVCCISTSCASVTCPVGSHKVSTSPICTNCTAAICCEENICQSITAGQLPEYISGGGPTCTTASGCSPVICAAGYHVDTKAELMCVTHGGLFTGNGCIENTCVPTVLIGYTTIGDQCTSVSSCGTVQCSTGYSSSGTPSVVCPTEGGALIGVNCKENICQPQDLSAVQPFATMNPNCTTATSCGQITCARGYTASGTPSISCPVQGGDFKLTGCDSNTCLSPLVIPGSGFTASIPSCTRTEQCGTISCSDGYYQSGSITPTLVCPFSNGVFEVNGCLAPSQAPPTALPTDVPFTPVPPPPGVTLSPDDHCGICPERTVCRYITESINDYNCVTSCEGITCGPLEDCDVSPTGYSICVIRPITLPPTPRPPSGPRTPTPPSVSGTPVPGTVSPTNSSNNLQAAAASDDDGNLTWVVILLACIIVVIIAAIVIKLLCFQKTPAARLGSFLQGVDPEISFENDQQEELTPNFKEPKYGEW